MKYVLKTIWLAVASFAVFTVVCGLAYTGFVTVVSQSLFRERANGSVVTVRAPDGTERSFGSELLAQEFTKPEYLIGRPLGTTNLSPTGNKERDLVAARVAVLRSLDADDGSAIPADLVTASGSGVDPNISPEAAEYQVSRIARARGMSESAVRDAIEKNTGGRFLGVFGERFVNVLRVNLTLDGLL